MADPRKLLVVVAHNQCVDKTTIAFTIATASLSAGMEVAVFLTSDGVEAAQHGATDQPSFRPFKPLAELLEAFVEKGGVVMACGSCCQHRGFRSENTDERVRVAGVAQVVEWIAAGAQILSL